MAKKRRGYGEDLALAIGDLDGRVAYCFRAPAGLRRKGKPVTKVCLPRQYGASSTIFRKDKRGRAKPFVSTAYVERLGKGAGRPEKIAAYKFSQGHAEVLGTGKRADGYDLPTSRRGKKGKKRPTGRGRKG